MFWLLFGAAVGATSKHTPGAEHAITAFGVVMNVYGWSMYLYLKRQQAKRRTAKAAAGD